VKSSIKKTGTFTLTLLFSLLLVMMVNYLSIRHYKRWDLTREKVYSLTDQSTTILKELSSDVTIYVLFDPLDPLYDQLNELMTRYRAASDRISVDMLDPEKDLIKVKDVAEKYGINQQNLLVITSGDRKKFVYKNDLAEMDYSGMQYGQPPTVKAFQGEEAVTSAILSVTDVNQVTVAFLAGHGEKGIEDYTGAGLSSLKDQLEKENYLTKTIALLGQDKVEDDVDVLVIAGPRTRMLDPEMELIRSFLARGGRLLVLADPVFPQRGDDLVPLGLEPLLLEYGVKLLSSVVLDTGRMLPFVGPEAIYVDSYRSHPITDKMQKIPCIFPVMRAIQTVTPSQNVDVSVLMTTTDQGWGETNIGDLLKTGQAEQDKNDDPGPITLGVAISPTKNTEQTPGMEEESKDVAEAPESPDVRIVVIGDSDFMSNDQVPNLGNINFAVNTIHWLSERESLISIPSKRPEQAHIQISRSQIRTIVLIVVLALPLLGIIIGVVVWRSRRK